MKVIGLNDRALAEQIIGLIRGDDAEPLVIDYMHLGHGYGVADVYAWYNDSMHKYEVEVDGHQMKAHYKGILKN